MIHLLDASALITAHNTFLALHRVPEFWNWLRHHGNEGAIKLPRAIYEEIEDGTDALATWMSDRVTKDALMLREATDGGHMRRVMAHYCEAPTEAELVTIGKDPFLVAAAMVAPAMRCVVTSEVSKPRRQGANRHIPDICNDCGVQWITPVQLLNDLNFTTSWEADLIG